MTDDRFYERAGPFSLAEIAGRIGAQMAKSETAVLAKIAQPKKTNEEQD